MDNNADIKSKFIKILELSFGDFPSIYTRIKESQPFPSRETMAKIFESLVTGFNDSAIAIFLNFPEESLPPNAYQEFSNSLHNARNSIHTALAQKSAELSPFKKALPQNKQPSTENFVVANSINTSSKFADSLSTFTNDISSIATQIRNEELPADPVTMATILEHSANGFKEAVSIVFEQFPQELLSLDSSEFFLDPMYNTLCSIRNELDKKPSRLAAFKRFFSSPKNDRTTK